MSQVAQPVSVVAPVTDIVLEEVIALLAEPSGSNPAAGDVRLGMDLVEIAQEQVDEDAIDLLRISSSVPV